VCKLVAISIPLFLTLNNIETLNRLGVSRSR